MLQLLLRRGQLLLELFDQRGIGRKWRCRKTGSCIHDELLSSRAELWNAIILFSVYAVGINSVVVHLASVPSPISYLAEIDPSQQHREFFCTQHQFDFSRSRLWPAKSPAG